MTQTPKLSTPEQEFWKQVFLSISQRSDWTPQGCASVADEAVEMLRERQGKQLPYIEFVGRTPPRPSDGMKWNL